VLRRSLVHAVILCAIFTIAVGLRAQDSVSVPYPRPRPALVSQFDSANAVKELRTRLNNVFTSRIYRGSHVSVAVWSLRSGKPLYEYNPFTALTPASNTKIVSTAAVFNTLGKGGTINTEIRADGPIDVNGTLRGNLYIVGCGDALLSAPDLEFIADKVRAAGVKRITGNVYGDDSFFDNVSSREIYSGDGEQVQAVAPIVPLTLNKSTLAVIVTAASNGRTTVQTLPSSDGVEIVGNTSAPAQVVTPKIVAPIKRKKIAPAKSKRAVRSKTKSRVPTKRKPIVSKKKRRHAEVLSMQIDRYGDVPRQKNRRRRKAARSRVRVTSAMLSNGIQQITIHGSPGANRSYTTYVNMSNPTVACAGTLSTRLRTAGVFIDGTVGEKIAPSNSKLITSFRRPFVDFASVVNKRSDNYLAEHVFKMLGGLHHAKTNTAQTSKRLMVEVFDSLGVPRMECSFNDGSGLSRRNKICAASLAGLLAEISKLPWGPEFASTLSIAGFDGTVRGRMKGTLAENNVKAKTGTLRNTSALSGYVVTADGEPLAFSFISNGPNVRGFKGSENQAAVLLANFSYGTPIPATIDSGTNDESDEESAEELPANKPTNSRKPENR